MASVRRVGDLDIDEDDEFQRRTWKVQRHAWAGMGLIVVAALSGLFGVGPLSRGEVGDEAGPLAIRYPRFGRLGASTPLEFRFRPGPSGEARIWLDVDFLDAIQIEGIEPEPVRVEAAEGRSAYVFRAISPGRPTRATFHLRPDRIGPISARASLDDGPVLEFGTFIYP